MSDLFENSHVRHEVSGVQSQMDRQQQRVLGNGQSGAQHGGLHKPDEKALRGELGKMASSGEALPQQVVAFVVPGEPVGKGRPKFARRGNFVSTYTPEKTANYENLVKVKAEQAMQGRQLFEGAVAVDLVLRVSVPQSWSQKKRKAALSGESFPTSKPDVDNVIKGLFDACNDIVWKDDKQVVHLSVIKLYAEKPEAVMKVRAM